MMWFWLTIIAALFWVAVAMFWVWLDRRQARRSWVKAGDEARRRLGRARQGGQP